MPANAKRSRSFGSVQVDHLSPAQEAQWPKSMHIKLSFKEALKLHLGLGRLLGRLCTYDRASAEGRRAGLRLSLYPKTGRIAINEGKLRPSQD